MPRERERAQKGEGRGGEGTDRRGEGRAQTGEGRGSGKTHDRQTGFRV